jgi:putative ABC transport system permease protein
MTTLRSFFFRLRNLFHKSQLDHDLDAELSSHLALHIEDNLRKGLSSQEARRQALLTLGGLEQTKQLVRDQQTLPLLETFFQDLRFTLLNLRHSPAFTAAAVLTLALGIGANTAIFSFADLLLHHPVSLQHLDRLVSLSTLRPGTEESSLSPANFRDLRASTATIENLAAYEEWFAHLLGTNGAEEVPAVRVTDHFFAALDAQPAQGRSFLAEEFLPGKNRVVILSYAFWQHELAADPHFTNKTLRLDGDSYNIVGVMPANFQFPPGGTQLWVPLAFDAAQASDRTHATLSTVGRLKSGATIDQARAELNTLWNHLQLQYPDANRQTSLSILPLRERLVDEDSRQFILLFLVVAAFVLLIACVNVANLQLARAAGRQRELSIRSALGAARSRLIRQLFTESLLLAAIGAAAGLLLALWGVSLMRANMPAQVREICDINGMGLDLRAFLFTLFVAVAAGVLSGALPALRASQQNLRDALESGSSRMAGAGNRLRRVFVISEVILAVVLLIGAGLMVKGFYLLATHQTAMQPQSLLTFRLNLTSSRNALPQQRLAFYQELLARLKNIPGVDRVSAVSGLPYSFYENDVNLRSDRPREAPDAESPTAMLESISDDYFAALHLPLREGRLFDPRDASTAAPVAIISESMARRFWPGVQAVGHRLRLSDSPSPDSWVTIVGVVADIRHEVYDRSFRSILYIPLAQAPPSSMDFALRTSADPILLARSVRSAVAELDFSQPVTLLHTMAEKINAQASALQFTARLMALFGLIAILLSAAGIYGLLSHSVVERRREIGIRIALGAHPRQVLLMVLRQGASLVAVGGAIGLLVGLLLARVLSSLLYGVQAWDPTIYFAVPLLLALVTLVATLVPAIRAATLDPVVTLRYD